MRRRFAFRLPRRRREPPPPLTREAHERRQLQHLALVSILLALALWGTLAVRSPTTPGLELGRPSPVSIQARRSTSYQSTWRTEQERARAESSPDAEVYSRDSGIPIQQRRELRALLETIAQIRNDPMLSPEDEQKKLTSLPNSSLVISETLAARIANLDSKEWGATKQYAEQLYDRAMNEYDYAISDQDLIQLRERSLPYWSSLVPEQEEVRDLVLLFSSSFLKANQFLDVEATQKRKQELRDSVKPVTVQILDGESIVRQGDVVTPDIQEKLVALGDLPTATNWLDVSGRGLLAALTATIFGVYLWQAQREIWIADRPLLVVAGMVALTTFAARLALSLSSDWSYAFPLAATALLFATLFNNALALVTTTLVSVMIAFVGGGNQFALGTTLMLGSMAGVFVVGRGERSLTFLVAGLAVVVTTALARSAFWLTTFGPHTPDQLLPILIFSGMNGALSAIMALGLYNLAGHLADVVTPIQLMELAHPAHPLLRKLIREAPGTYYHSVAVGNLAENAAEAIGADALLLRVASYYHDIGKTIRPYFFTDNQSDRENVHNELDPRTSAEIICDHVREGVKLARAAGLPRQIIEFIPAHHGTSVIKHFYQIALQQEDSVNVDDYRYPGPKPRTREQAIMMLADAVEATVRAKAQHGKIASSREEAATSNGRGQNGKQTLEELVNAIIDDRIRSGQLDESSLTLQDIKRIRQAFITTLQGIYHPRVDYAPQVVKPVER